MKLAKKKRFRKLQSAILTAALLAGIPTASFVNNTTEAHAAEYWAQPYLQQMLNEGIMSGNSNGNLNPSDQITRAEFVTMINRALGFTKRGNATFTDVTPSDWYYNDILVGANEGYFQGVAANTAAPKNPITREAAVTMLGRALRLPVSPTNTNNFTDNNSISNWSRAYVNTGAEKGFVSGYSNGSFSPQNKITRAEVAKMLSTLTGTIVDEARQVRLDYVDGNVTLTRAGGGLKNTVIAGDLYITDGVGTGNILLDNVTVLGQVIISGGGESSSGDCSVIFRDCDINDLIVDTLPNKKLSLSTQGSTIISDSEIKSNAFIQSANTSGIPFSNLVINTPENGVVDLNGAFNNVIVKGAANTMNLRKGKIEQLTVDEDSINSKVFLESGTNTTKLFTDTATNVTGKGSIGESVIGTNGTVIEQLPDKITIRPGVTANINGQDMTNKDSEDLNIIPEIAANYPKISEENLTTAKATFKSNKAAKLYWIVIPQGFSAPSAQQLINPNLIGNAVQSGNLNISEATDTDINLTGLTMGTDYTIYGMLVDQRNVQSDIKKADFSTVDNTAPRFTYTSAEPQTVQAGERYNYNISATATVSKNATVYYAVMKNGDPAPTATDLINQRLPNAGAKGYKDFKGNESSTMIISGLEEKTDYTLYMIAVDNSNRQSAITNINVSTEDKTAPSLLRFVSTPGTNNINVNFTANEDCAKIYWALYYTNSPTVQEIEKESAIQDEGLVWYETTSAKDAIVRAAGAVQSAQNLNATANTDRNFNIQGLTPERYYKLYMVLEDASGNRSVAYTLETSTIDEKGPEVELSFGATDGTNLTVGTGESPTSLSLVFDEVVIGRRGDTMKELSASSVTNEDLDAWIQLYRGDVNTSQNVISEANRIKINWNEVKRIITEASNESPEHTVLTFSVSDEAKTALQLHSGESYTFVFTYNAASRIWLQDKSSNSMRETPTDNPTGGNYTAVTKTFKCVDPAIEISAPSGYSQIEINGETHNLDLSYNIKPTAANAATADEQKYDYYFSSDAILSANILQATKNTAGDWEWRVLAEKMYVRENTDVATDVDSSINRGESLTAYSSGDYNNQQFNKMQETIIAIEVLQLREENDRNAFAGELTGRLTCVIGDAQTLERKANAGADIPGRPSNRPNFITTTVGSALDHTAFSDQVAPIISLSPEDLTQEGTDEYNNRVYDTSVNIDVTLHNKDVILYWVAVRGKLNDNMSISSERVYDYIMAGGNEGDVCNKDGINLTQITSHPRTITIDGLESETDYTIYFVARSSTGDKLTTFDLSQGSFIDSEGNKQFVPVKTKPLIAPEFVLPNGATGNNYVEYAPELSNSEEVTFRVYTDRPATIYWTAVTGANSSAYEKILDPSDNDTDTGRFEIISPQNTGSYIRANGQEDSLKTAADNRYQTTITINRTEYKNLALSTPYYFYFMASHPEDPLLVYSSNYKRYGSYTFSDQTPPKITNISFSGIQGGNGPGIATYADVQITFDKPLYYKDNIDSTTAKPVTSSIADETLATGTGKNNFWSIFPATADGKDREYTVKVTPSSSPTTIDATVTWIDPDHPLVTLSSVNPISNADASTSGRLEIAFTVKNNACICSVLYRNNGTEYSRVDSDPIPLPSYLVDTPVED
ncbi:MAG: S-layer homology domain-containing protein [Firmicutes bacterium]|nr:S-layer homology domain-containing protein [Bacillota bacterium]